MTESELGGRFWFKAANSGKDARNVTFKERIGMSPYQAMYGEKKAVSDFRAFGCRAWYTQISSAERKQSTRREPKRQYTSGSPTA